MDAKQLSDTIDAHLVDKPAHDTEYHLCENCAKVSYEGFRAGSHADEIFRPRPILLGSFLHLTDSAFSGCWICRFILRHIVQRASSTIDLNMLYLISRIELRLSLDDELTMRLRTENGSTIADVDGSVLIKDGAMIVLCLSDGVWSTNWESDARKRYPGLRWEWDKDTMNFPGPVNCDSNRLVPNPVQTHDRLLVPHWLHTCISAHKSCFPQDKPTPLPTRVIDVGDHGMSMCKLTITNEQCGKYITLSHCWGAAGHALRLTKDNITALIEGIDDSEMPKTFREAIMITRSIGCKYLWIDSLCIIQPTDDDVSDWEIEGSKMSQVYRNSLLTIAASASRDSLGGCLKAKPTSQYNVYPVPLFHKPLHRKWDEFSKIMGRSEEWFPMMMPEPPSWISLVQDSPLYKRGWVFQERILSPRILHCTIQGLLWECNELEASEHEPLGRKFDYSTRKDEITSLPTLLSKDKELILGRYWRQVVQRFCQLKLTVPTDRLPALAGIATAVKEATGDTYVAGHWRNSLVSSLLWYRLQGKGPVRTSKRLPAPSWSWASTATGIRYTPLDETDYPARTPEDIAFPAEVVSFTSELNKLNPGSWPLHVSFKLRCSMRSDASPGGLPTFETVDSTWDSSWRGQVPTESNIPQLQSIFIPSLNKSKKDERDDKESSQTSQEDIGAEMARLALDHEALQASIKEAMRPIRAMKREKPAVRDREESSVSEHVPALVTWDDANFERHQNPDLALIEILRILDQQDKSHAIGSEGLVLSRTEVENNTYKRVGFFKWKQEGGFDGLSPMDIHLV